MSWTLNTTFPTGPVSLATLSLSLGGILNAIQADIRFWGGNVDAAGNSLLNLGSFTVSGYTSILGVQITGVPLSVYANSASISADVLIFGLGAGGTVCFDVRPSGRVDINNYSGSAGAVATLGYLAATSAVNQWAGHYAFVCTNSASNQPNTVGFVACNMITVTPTSLDTQLIFSVMNQVNSQPSSVYTYSQPNFAFTFDRYHGLQLPVGAPLTSLSGGLNIQPLALSGAPNTGIGIGLGSNAASVYDLLQIGPSGCIGSYQNYLMPGAGVTQGLALRFNSYYNTGDDYSLISGHRAMSILMNDAGIQFFTASGVQSSPNVSLDSTYTEKMRLTFQGTLNIGGNTTSTSNLNIANLPTSSAGLNSGDIWNSGGVLHVV